ncbi:MAG: rhodanese-like domain-containing protein [Proteobacteria bacterium]|nr:rhodanese-like domain-containing protein [Pseudomonadota bacterium]
MDQLSEFVVNNLILFAALLAVMVMLIKAELDHQANKGLFVSPANAIRLMNNNGDALVIDIRTANEFDGGHIKGAKNMPLSDLTKTVADVTASKDKPVLIYCNSGNTAGRAIKILQNAGFVKISNLAGGIAAWKEANMPLTKK